MKTIDKPLKDIAKVIRSKNSGPFEVTFDIIFRNREDFERVRESGAFTKSMFAALYRIPEDTIGTFGFFEPINAIKVTIPRPRPQGSIGETDMHAAQMHVPLQSIAIPWPAD
ncbi:DUF4387 domain-containing protein [Pigmentiphaga soli]|uniref:DUF4387 domain-containing protein n=1 Tax=Pigmentiphaga soli TaxID=1007095 RepID=A0ABP8HEK5_9BURK